MFTTKKKYERLQNSNVELQKMIVRKDTEIEFLKKDFKLKAQAQVDGKTHVINDVTDYLDPLPEDMEGRKAVVSKISGWFEGELGVYMKHMITRMEHEIARFPITERETDFFRAGINFGHLLLDWGSDIIGEHRANIMEQNNSETEDALATPKEEEAIENIKNKVK